MSASDAILWYDRLDSSNNEAARLISGLDNLAVIAVREQTAGRGQGDHSWYSAPGQNLTFSLVLKFPPLNPLPASGILYLTCAITRGIRQYLLGRGVESLIKWHNDIYVDGRKICGILIENTISGGLVRSCIAGIGLNLNQTDFPPELPNPVSLKQLTLKNYDPATELESLVGELKKSASLLDTEQGRIELESYFRKYCFNVPVSQQ